MSKKRLLLVFALGLAALLPVAAQLPDVSTADAPKWYYIQVLGSDTRVGRVFTLSDDDKVTGQAMTTSLDATEVGKQLWRFEKNAAGRYTITNKASGKQLDVTYDSSVGSARAIVADESAQTFAFNTLNDYYQIELETAVTSGEKWLHQGNSGYSFAVITVGTTWSSANNSQWSFVEYVDPAIIYSDSETLTYYTIANASETFSNRVVREAVNDDGTSASITLEDFDEGDTAAQWYAVNTGEGVRWLNRATGHVLQTTSEPYGLFNILTAGTVVATGNAWTATYLGEGQYTFSVTEDDNIVRYMGADSEDAEEASHPDELKLPSSTFAWILTKVESIPTAISSATAAEEAYKVVGRNIVGKNIRIHTLGGVAMPAGHPLAPGVYLVTAAGQTTKVLVK